MLVHLDTDLGGDPDDACALAMLLGWPGVELAGVTTVLDAEGWRAAYVHHLLDLAGRAVPVATGAAVSLTTRRRADPVVGDPRHWPAGLEPAPSPAGAALDLLERSVAAGAAVVAIGPLTNLALLEVSRPELLARAPLTLMGGWVDPPGPGLPAWGPDMDFNLQWDPDAARIVLAAAATPTLATLPATLGAPLRTADLPRLRRAGPLGRLLAEQSEAHAAATGMAPLGLAHAGLPDDLLNLHYDPAACAVAVGWDGATVEACRLAVSPAGTPFRLRRDPAGRPARVVTTIDGASFTEAWLAAVEAAGS